MDIGFDYDDTLVEHAVPFYEIVGELLGRKLVIGKQWLYPHFKKDERELTDQLWRFNWYMNGCTRPKVYTKETLAYLKSEGHKVHIITARHHSLKEQTKEAIDRFFPGIVSSVSFIDGPEKVAHLKQMNIRIWVDDNPHTCADAYVSGIRTIVIDKPYNRNLTPSIERVYIPSELHIRLMETIHAEKRERQRRKIREKDSKVV